MRAPHVLRLHLVLRTKPKNSWPPVPKPALRPVVPAYPACYRLPRGEIEGCTPKCNPGVCSVESSRNQCSPFSHRRHRIPAIEPRPRERQSPHWRPRLPVASSALLSERRLPRPGRGVSALSFGLLGSSQLSIVDCGPPYFAQLFHFQAITNSLSFSRTLTPLFSGKSTLFHKNTRGRGYPCFSMTARHSPRHFL
jgi:hypothetical protein